MDLYEVIQGIVDDGGRVVFSPTPPESSPTFGGLHVRVWTYDDQSDRVFEQRFLRYLYRARDPKGFLANQLTHVWQDIQAARDKQGD